MDDYHCRYGFMATHGRTWMVKRIIDNHFLVSGIKVDAKATEEDREKAGESVNVTVELIRPC